MIRLLALDVDGTLTDGGVYMDGRGGEYKRFDVKDGMGIAMLLRAGVEVAFISGRYSAATEQRARNLGVARVHNGVKEKLPVLAAMAQDMGITLEQTAFMGDDVNDLECLTAAGLGLAPADAVRAVREAADYVTGAQAGRGAVREAAEHILALNGEEES